MQTVKWNFKKIKQVNGEEIDQHIIENAWRNNSSSIYILTNISISHVKGKKLDSVTNMFFVEVTCIGIYNNRNTSKWNLWTTFHVQGFFLIHSQIKIYWNKIHK